MPYLRLILFTCTLSACSSHIPVEIQQALEGAPTVTQARQAEDDHLNKNVRWGGMILSTENKPHSSWITVLAFPLDSSGEPQNTKVSQGRFIAIIDQFLEPTIYSHKREITFSGKLLGTETYNVGEFPYQYPIIEVEHFYLWAPKPETRSLDYPPLWWHDSFYNPYYRHHH